MYANLIIYANENVYKARNTLIQLIYCFNICFVMQVHEENLDLRHSLKLNFKILCMLGYWPPEDAGYLLILYRIYSMLIIGGGFVIYTTTEIINIALSLNDLTKLTDASFLFLTHLAQVLKLYYFTVNHDRILKLLNSLNRDIFQPRNETQIKIIKVEMKYSKSLYVIFIAMCTATVLLWGAFPIMDKKEKIELPLSAWYPFSTNSWPVFEIIYFYQISAVLMNAIANISMDTVASGFMAHICGQLDVLNDALTHIRDQANVNLNKRKIKITYNENSEDFKKELQQQMDEEIIRCVVHHINIIE